MSENFAESSSMAARRSGSDIPSTPMSVDDNLSQATSDTTEDAPILSRQQSMMSTDTESFFAPPNATTGQKRRESWTSKNHWAKSRKVADGRNEWRCQFSYSDGHQCTYKYVTDKKGSTGNMIDHLKNVHNITKESPAKGTSLVPRGLAHSAPALQDLKLPSDTTIKRHLTSTRFLPLQHTRSMKIGHTVHWPLDHGCDLESTLGEEVFSAANNHIPCIGHVINLVVQAAIVGGLKAQAPENRI
ncbi:hypothetical protein BDA99DRAFT_566804 [Phascolomyces articulosus]|uniref:Uncharacterized protein n=1 Tax=Phascolomyces articulosus TaxID=60185 RepID=A0AAD5JK45_9FUNG|nr:hypothetical protein BDA99DRAFT_566804 [Phascolomyces articulosus]